MVFTCSFLVMIRLPELPWPPWYRLSRTCGEMVFFSHLLSCRLRNGPDMTKMDLM
ncbi:hypothetical protein PAXRUDRAFT_493834 [Paxillus rubicundulus Ve08.2h10]|uniref:Uncharacterized protein n=1 Tax=Paxillus rubicundulus Ve08.2h10 TaxID=930991 RepID=A0A0D0DDB0_9AGAM|nr:hypothetical protein PAXRUDRAFT_493834 [Paxillus rubicundulus Ve08.2h10]